jgi:hypothetical protein
MPDDDYEIMPHSSLDKLKADLESLKKTTGSSGSSKETMDAVNALKTSIEELLDIFKVASEDMKMQEAEAVGVEKKIGPLIRKVDTLIEQNQELAKGIVVIADMLKDQLPQIQSKLEKKEEHKEKPLHQDHPKPQHEDLFSSYSPPERYSQSPPQPMNRAPPRGPPNAPSPRMPPQPMPSMAASNNPPDPFPGLEEPPKKEGIFGKIFKK